MDLYKHAKLLDQTIGVEKNNKFMMIQETELKMSEKNFDLQMLS